MGSAQRKDKRAKQLIQAGRESKGLHDKIESLEAELARLRSDLNARAIVQTDLETKLATAREAVAGLESQTSAAIAEAERVKRILATRDTEIAALRDDLEAKSKRLDQLEAEERDAKKLRRRLADDKAEMRKLQLEVQRHRAALSSCDTLEAVKVFMARHVTTPMDIPDRDPGIAWMEAHARTCERQKKMPLGFADDAYTSVLGRGQSKTHRRVTCRSCGAQWPELAVAEAGPDVATVEVAETPCAGCGHARELHDVAGGPPGCSYNGPEVDCTCPCSDFVPAGAE